MHSLGPFPFRATGVRTMTGCSRMQSDGRIVPPFFESNPDMPMATLPALPELAPGLYRHYKGNDYEVVAVARHSETLEPVVVYHALYGEGGLWVRPYAMFCEEVVVDGRSVRRFAPVE